MHNPTVGQRQQERYEELSTLGYDHFVDKVTCTDIRFTHMILVIDGVEQSSPPEGAQRIPGQFAMNKKTLNVRANGQHGDQLTWYGFCREREQREKMRNER